MISEDACLHPQNTKASQTRLRGGQPQIAQVAVRNYFQSVIRDWVRGREWVWGRV